MSIKLPGKNLGTKQVKLLKRLKPYILESYLLNTITAVKPSGIPLVKYLIVKRLNTKKLPL